MRWGEELAALLFAGPSRLARARYISLITGSTSATIENPVAAHYRIKARMHGGDRCELSDENLKNRVWPSPLPADGVVRDPSLLPADFSQIAITGIGLENILASRIRQALTLVPPEERRRVSFSLKWVVPIFGVEGISETSLSSMTLPCVAFISPKSILGTIEALVHEAAHQELFMYETLMHDEGQWSLNERDKFGTPLFSPWRSELRPAIAVLHAAYVFIRIGNVMEAGELPALSKGRSSTPLETEQKRVRALLPSLQEMFMSGPFGPLLASIESSLTQWRGALT